MGEEFWEAILKDVFKKQRDAEDFTIDDMPVSQENQTLDLTLKYENDGASDTIL